MFHYVYILVSETNPGRQYIGLTADLNARLAAHNAGKVSHHLKIQTLARGNSGSISLPQEGSGF
jgi:predicted GIY-YIG superfamily endonuclease